MKAVFRFSLLSVFLVLFAVAPAAAQNGAVLNAVTAGKDGDRLSIRLDIDGDFAFESSLLPAPPRLIVDLAPVSRNLALPYTQVGEAGVVAVRTGASGPDSVRVVFDLSPEVPAFRLVRSPAGLSVIFWNEEVVPPFEDSIKKEPAKPEGPSAPAATAPREMRVPGRSGFFVSARAGLPLFLSPDLSVRNEFNLYGETGSLDEAYSFETGPSLEIQVGRRFGRTKIGMAAASWPIREPGTFTAVIPHPFLTDAHRTVTFSASDSKYPAWSLTAFALFPIFETGRIAVSAGPMLGLTRGKTRSLDNFKLTEKSPFTAADTAVSNLTYIEESFSELLLGGLLGLEYRPTPPLSLLLDLRMVYLNPRNIALNQRVSLLHFQPVFGLQYNF